MVIALTFHHYPTMRVSRETLFHAIWSEPMTVVAKRYNVTSTYLARVCSQLKVPRPPRGYWQMLEAGAKLERPSLPPVRVGDQAEWLRNEPPPLLSAPESRPIPAAPTSKGAVGSRAAAHPVIALARNEFLNARISDEGYLEPRKKELPDVCVSKPQLRRALAVANELYRQLEQHGHRVVIAPRDRLYVRPHFNPMQRVRGKKVLVRSWGRIGRGTLAFVGDVPIGVTIYEVTENVSVRSVDNKYVRVTETIGRRFEPWQVAYPRDMPSGRLGVNAYAPYLVADWQQHWQESAPGELEAKLQEIAAEIEAAAPVVAQLVQDGLDQQRRQREELQADIREANRREQQERERAAQKQSREQLVGIVNAWAFAQRVEEFFAEAAHAAEKLGSEERAELLSRLAHARNLLGGTDAIKHFLAWRPPDDLPRR